MDTKFNLSYKLPFNSKNLNEFLTIVRIYCYYKTNDMLYPELVIKYYFSI